MIRGAEICPRITITKITISEKEMHLQKEQECGEMSRKTKKCGYRKRILAGVLSAVVALSSVQMPVTAVHAAAWDQNKFSDSLKLRFWNNEKPGVRFYINAAAKYILENQQEQSEKTGNSYPTVEVRLENGQYGICCAACIQGQIILTAYRRIIFLTI